MRYLWFSKKKKKTQVILMFGLSKKLSFGGFLSLCSNYDFLSSYPYYSMSKLLYEEKMYIWGRVLGERGWILSSVITN